MVSPIRAETAPDACLAILPVSRRIERFGAKGMSTTVGGGGLVESRGDEDDERERSIGRGRGA